MADVVVTRDGDSGLGAGMIIGIVVVLLAVGFAIWYFGFGGNAAPNNSTDININNNPPVTVPSAAPQSS
jgi:hypothetical protein